MLILERSGGSLPARLPLACFRRRPPAPVDVDRGIRDQDATALAVPDHVLDDVEQFLCRALRLAEFAGRLEIIPGDPERVFDELRNLLHALPTPPWINCSLPFGAT